MGKIDSLDLYKVLKDKEGTPCFMKEIGDLIDDELIGAKKTVRAKKVVRA